MKTVYAALIILALSLAAYSNTFKASFHFDDNAQIPYNENIRDLGNLPMFFQGAELSSYDERCRGYRPLLYSSFALNYAISANDTWSYHVLNFVLHFLNSLMVFLVLSVVLKNRIKGDPFAVSLITALVFAVHPIQTDAVTYISGRSALLSAFFCLSSLLCYMLFREGGSKAKYAYAALSPVLFFLGLMSKETAVALLGLVLLYDTLLFLPGRRPGLPKHALYYLPFMGSLLAFLVIRKAVQGFATVPGTGFGVGQYMMSEAGVSLMYVRLMFLPFNLNADYNLPLAQSVDAPVVTSVCALAAFLFLLFRMRESNPVAVFFGAWFLLALAPESSFIPIADTAVEYRMYLPSTGFIAAVALALSGLVTAPRVRKAAVVMVCIIFTSLTFIRNAVWADELSLWGDTVKKSPYSQRAHLNLGCAMLAAGRYKDAGRELEGAVDIAPYNYNGLIYFNLGVCYTKLNETDQAIRAFESSLELDPGDMDAMMKLGELYIVKEDYGNAVTVLSKAAHLRPEYAPVRYSLARAYESTGRLKEALAELEGAYRYAPADFGIVYGLAVMYDENGLKADALSMANMARGLAQDSSQQQMADNFIFGLGK